MTDLIKCSRCSHGARFHANKNVHVLKTSHCTFTDDFLRVVRARNLY